MKKIRHIRELKRMQKELMEKTIAKQLSIANNWSGLKNEFKPKNIAWNFFSKLFGFGSDKPGTK